MSALRGAGRRTGMTTNQSFRMGRPIVLGFTLRKSKTDIVNIPVENGPSPTARWINKIFASFLKIYFYLLLDNEKNQDNGTRWILREKVLEGLA